MSDENLKRLRTLVAMPHFGMYDVRLALTEVLAHLEEATRETPSLKNHRHMVKSDEWLAAVMTTAEITELATEPVSKPSSSEGIGTAGAIRYTSHISHRLLFPANQAGSLMPSVMQDISAWLNSRTILGNEQVEVTLMIRTPKDSTPPDGSPSQSTAPQNQSESGRNSVSGVPGAAAQSYQSQAGREDAEIEECEYSFFFGKAGRVDCSLPSGHDGWHRTTYSWADPVPDEERAAP